MPAAGVLFSLLVTLALRTSDAFPNWFPDEELGRGNWSCGQCDPDLCPETRGCRAGLVPDACGCCEECGNLEGQACDPAERSAGVFGLCGAGLRCQQDPGPGGASEQDGEERVCVCVLQEPVCGSDGTTYSNECQFRQAKFSSPELEMIGMGACRTVPVIKLHPQHQIRSTGTSLVFLCEVFAFPIAAVEWTKEGGDVVLPGDDAHISVQSRGGPRRFELSSWLQIEGAQPQDSGSYRCSARNHLGTASAVAWLEVRPSGDLSSPTSPRVSELDLMESDYDLDYY
ncbi:kazal-type serine peptidase inhibitor domain 3 [Synchiropus splendidus]|uniref:kazal-type serine peptidase inhibitor domain 3 n=1 Tax=Synchiropus splendidus TaxID=270530 RepID=UPI00237DA82D|nr:kazal-type serine peptidase inhibitor domain 3 [Synchiropus splendidus]